MIRKPGTVFTEADRHRPNRAERLKPGDVVGGHYVVQSLLDEGGMAVVYRAENSSTGKPCALKILHAQLGDRPEFVRLFAKEAKVSSVVGDNEHIVQVYDAGLDGERGIPFIVMELLDGETLERMLERGPLAPELLRTLMSQLAGALEQAHAAGVVHRDLKPSNVFIGTDKHGAAHLKVMDFGIAKVMEGEAIRTATQVGTPAYNAPEQMGSTTRKLAAKQGITIAPGISAQTDVWALGLLTYEMMTGDLPGMYWGVETLSELPMKVAFEEHEPASRRAGRNAALLPIGFDLWFARCLRKNASERWGSVTEAVEELFTLLDDTPMLVDEAELQSVSTRLVAPAHNTGRKALGTAKSVRRAAADPPPLPRISSPEISEAVALSSADHRTPRSGVSESPSELRAKGMMSSAPPLVTDNEAVTPTPAKASASGNSWQSAAVLTLMVGGVGAMIAYGINNQPQQATNAVGGCEPESATSATVEDCQSACDSGTLGSCQRLGGLLLANKADAKLPAAAGAFAKACGLAAPTADTRAQWLKDSVTSECTNGSCISSACVSAAELYQQGADGLMRDERVATALYKRACRVGYADGAARGSAGCVGLGEMRVAAGETAAARGYFEAACEDGLSNGCVALARLHERGDSVAGIARDEKRARILFQKACDGGDLEGCTRLGDMVEHGLGGWVKDDAAAVALYKRACEGGQQLGCVHLASAYLTGKGKLTRDAVHAVELLHSSCDAGEQEACARLAVMVHDGKGGMQRDHKRAFTLNEKACSSGALAACVQLGEMYQRGEAGLTKDVKEATQLFERACRGGEARGCVAQVANDATLSNERKAALLGSACDAGDARGCGALGTMVEQGTAGERDATRAATLFTKACKGDVFLACTQLANLTYQGAGVKRDAKRSVALNEKACKGGEKLGCVRLGLLYAWGDGVAEDKKRATTLHAQACTGELSEDMQGRCDKLAKAAKADAKKK